VASGIPDLFEGALLALLLPGMPDMVPWDVLHMLELRLAGEFIWVFFLFLPSELDGLLLNSIKELLNFL
jgi:hypothetical protein